MRVALLYPEVYDMARFKDKRKEFPPFGVLYLAAVIEQAGHTVTVQAVTPSRTRLDLSGYDAVGFSLASSATYGLMLQARRVRIRRARADHGGRGALQLLPRVEPGRFQRDLAADGESEETILEILERGRPAGLRRYTGDLVAGPGRKDPPQSLPGR